VPTPQLTMSFTSGDITRLEDVVAPPTVEAIHRGVAAGADEVVPSHAAVDQILLQAVRDLV
jgi:hypothetical protein